MPVLNEDGTDAADPDRQQRSCSCLPFCLWGASGSRGPSKPGGSRAKRRRRRRRRRLKLSWAWLAWPWPRKSGKGDASGGDDDGSSKEGKKRRRKGGRRRLLLLLTTTTSLQLKKALASVVSGDSALLPVVSGDGALLTPPAKVSSLGDAKKQSNRRPGRPTADDAARGSRQPQPLATAATASTGWTTAPAGSRPETTSQPSPKPTDGPAASGRTWRAPSRRQRHSLHQPDCSCSSSGLWTAATTLGVIVLLGRVTAVAFLCSCLYGARFVRAWAAGDAGASAKAQLSRGGVVNCVGSSSQRFSDPVGVAGDEVVAEVCTTEWKKKVVMAGLLDRAGKAPSSRFRR